MTRRRAIRVRSCSAISAAFGAVTPLTAFNFSGSCSITHRVSAPKRCTSLAAVEGPTPLTAPEDRKARISSSLSGMRRSAASMVSCRP